jgi:hypothetical protein
MLALRPLLDGCAKSSRVSKAFKLVSTVLPRTTTRFPEIEKETLWLLVWLAHSRLLVRLHFVPSAHISGQDPHGSNTEPMQTPMNCGSNCGVSGAHIQCLQVIAGTDGDMLASAHNARSDSGRRPRRFYIFSGPGKMHDASGVKQSRRVVNDLLVFYKSTSISFWFFVLFHRSRLLDQLLPTSSGRCG